MGTEGTRQEFGDLNFEIDVILFLVWILTQGSGLPQMGQFLLADIFSFMVCFFSFMRLWVPVPCHWGCLWWGLHGG